MDFLILLLINSFINQDQSRNPRILLTHVPLFRPDDTPCGPLRNPNKPYIKQGAGYQYQSRRGGAAHTTDLNLTPLFTLTVLFLFLTDLIVEPLSKFVLESVKPYLVFSGDDHDDCE